MGRRGGTEPLSSNPRGVAYTAPQREVGMRYLEGVATREELTASTDSRYVETVDRLSGVVRENHRLMAKNGLIGKTAAEFYEKHPWYRRDYFDPTMQAAVETIGRVGGKRIPEQHLKRDFPGVTWKEGGRLRYRKFHPDEFGGDVGATMAAQEWAAKLKGKSFAWEGEPIDTAKITDVKPFDALTKAERESMGEIRDPAVVLARSIGIQEHALAVNDFLGKLARDRTIARDTNVDLPASFSKEPIPNSRAYGPLAGKYVRSAVRAEVVGMLGQSGGAADAFLRVLETANRALKLSKTVWNPGTHARNFTSNIVFAELAPNGASPARPSDWKFYKRAFGLLRAEYGSPEFDVMKELTRLGAGYKHGNVASMDSILKLVDEAGGESFVQKRESVVRKVLDSGYLPDIHNALRSLYEAEDMIYKVAHVAKQLDAGKPLDVAAKEAMRYFPTYERNPVTHFMGGASKAKRWLNVTAIPPFLNFTVDAPLIIGTHASERPGSVAMLSAALAGVTAASLKILGISDDEWEKIKANSPDWRPVGGIPTPLLPWRNADGKLQTIDLRYNLPLADTGYWIEALFSERKARGNYFRLGANSLVLAPIADYGYNLERWMGGTIYDESSMTPEEVTDAKLDHFLRAYVPPVLGSSLQRLGQGITGKAVNKEGDTRGLLEAVADVLGGVRTRAIDPQREYTARQKKTAALAYKQVDELKADMRSAQTEQRPEIKARLERSIAWRTAEIERLLREFESIPQPAGAK